MTELALEEERWPHGNCVFMCPGIQGSPGMNVQLIFDKYDHNQDGE